MGWQIIKQPNGKYCIFSSIVDNILWYNGTKEETIQYCIDAEILRIKKSLRHDLEQTIEMIEEGGKPYYQFTKTFDGMIETIRTVHGDTEADNVLKTITKTENETSEI